jgi:hypothetical protein
MESLLKYLPRIFPLIEDVLVFNLIEAQYAYLFRFFNNLAGKIGQKLIYCPSTETISCVRLPISAHAYRTNT